MGNKSRKKNIKYRPTKKSTKYQTGGDNDNIENVTAPEKEDQSDIGNGEAASTVNIQHPVLENGDQTLSANDTPKESITENESNDANNNSESNAAEPIKTVPEVAASNDPAIVDQTNNKHETNEIAESQVVDKPNDLAIVDQSKNVEPATNVATVPDVAAIEDPVVVTNEKTIKTVVEEFLKTIPLDQQNTVEVKQKIEEINKSLEVNPEILNKPLTNEDTNMIDDIIKTYNEPLLAPSSEAPSSQTLQSMQTPPPPPSYNEGGKVCVDDVNGVHVLFKVPKGPLADKIYKLIQENDSSFETINYP